MKLYKITILPALVLLCSANMTFAQKKSSKKPTITKESLNPEPPKAIQNINTNSDMEGYKQVPEVFTADFVNIEGMDPNPSQDTAKSAIKMKVYSKPFQFWPSVDTVMREDYNVFLARKKAALKNYSTGKAADYKEPVIKSIYEFCYRISNDNKDTTRIYGDGWTNKIEYDANGNMTTLYVIFENDVTQKDSAYLTTKYFYVADKVMLKEFYWWATGSKEAEIEMEYNENGNIWKEYYTPLDTSGNEIIEEGRGYRILYQYEKDAIIAEYYDRLEAAMNEYVLEKTITRKLDSKGNEINTETVDWPDGKPYSQYQKKYDAEGNLIFYGTTTDFTTYTYNKNGDMEMEKSVDVERAYNQSTDYKHKYDINNNWTERLETSTAKSESSKEVKTYLWKRIIHYYEK